MRGDESDLRAQQFDSGAIELVERADLRRREQTERVVECACPEFRLSRDQRALRTAYGSGCQRRSAFEERGSSSEAATRLRPRRRALELAGHLLVGRGRRLRTVPRAAIRVDLRIGCVRQRAVSLAPLVRLGRAVHRRAHERMTEHHCTVQRQQAFRLHGVRGRLWDPKLLALRATEAQGRRPVLPPPGAATAARRAGAAPAAA